MLNTVTLVGYAGKQPEVHYFKSGKILCKFPVVVNSCGNSGETLLRHIIFSQMELAWKRINLFYRLTYFGAKYY